ncbi:hypothetical protein [Marinimicrobium agarilyticum]|uniref:DUF7931 domain-containing protein n=1 Tax=Marinimicrobium agarilyticum TaxID=306546 RepID=UPI0006846A39|nr:hypothetical protein [Marinimicrobium agarilyticum]
MPVTGTYYYIGLPMTTETPPQKHFRLLEGPEAFREALIEAARHSRRDFLVFSPTLDPTVYDSVELIETLSALARSHRRATLQFLVQDTRPLAAQGHGLVRLCQRLPSKAGIRRITTDIETKAAAFALGDREQLVYQNDPDTYRGFWDWRAGAQVKTLREIFARAWETAEDDPQLRQLTL